VKENGYKLSWVWASVFLGFIVTLEGLFLQNDNWWIAIMSILMMLASGYARPSDLRNPSWLPITFSGLMATVAVGMAVPWYTKHVSLPVFVVAFVYVIYRLALSLDSR
jgi:hypothetical protein